MHMLPYCCDERRMTVLFLAGTYDTNVRSLVKSKIEEAYSFLVCQPLSYSESNGNLLVHNL